MTRSVTILLFAMALLPSLAANGQSALFRLYTDSLSLVADAAKVVTDFNRRVNALRPGLEMKTGFAVHTTEALVYYAPKADKVVASLYHQLPEQSRLFFETYSQSEDEARELFAYFFNGFFIPHELGHALVARHNLHDPKQMYWEELEANQIAMNYWHSLGKTDELAKCYAFARGFLAQVPDPVPEGEDRISWFNANYWELGKQPEKYGYFQFGQFVELYEDHDRIPIDEYLELYIAQLEEQQKNK